MHALSIRLTLRDPLFDPNLLLGFAASQKLPLNQQPREPNARPHSCLSVSSPINWLRCPWQYAFLLSRCARGTSAPAPDDHRHTLGHLRIKDGDSEI
jgi:hypothetical protein